MIGHSLSSDAEPTIPNPRRIGTGSRISGNSPSQPAPGSTVANAQPIPQRLAGGSPGRTLEGFAKFRVGPELGRGGMGSVLAAEDVGLHRELAIKVLASGHSAAHIAQFVEEAQITGQLEHPNIVPIHELGIDRHGRPWLAMKRIHGRNLRQQIEDWTANQPGALTPEFIGTMLGIFKKICDAVAFAHSRGVVHRDLKPENIMVGEYGEVLVMDWGLAKPLAKPLAGDDANARPVVSDKRTAGEIGTVVGAVFGTPAYMAPEQAMGDTAAIAEPADIFGLGGILYHLLTGKAPYAGADTAEVLHAAKNRDLLAPHRRAPQRSIPRELSAIVMKAMASVPVNRYRTVAALQADIAAFESFRGTHAYRAGLIERTIKWTRRHPMLAMSGTLSLLFVAVLGVIASLWVGEKQRTQFEADRRSAAERIAADRQAMLDAMEAGDYDYVLSLLSGQDIPNRSPAIENFHRLFAQSSRLKKPTAALRGQLNAAQIAELIVAYESLFSTRETRGVALTFDDFFEYAVLLCLDSDDHSRAISAFDRAIAANPSVAVAYFERGVCKVEIDDFAGAIADFEKAAELAPTDFDAWLQLGKTKMTCGDSAGAHAALDRAIQLDGNHDVAYFTRGAAQMALGNARAAIADLSRAVDINPLFVAAFFGRGEARCSLGDFAGGIKDFDTAFRLDPTSAEACARRGQANLALKNYDAALDDFARALSLDEANVMAYIGRGRVRFRLGHLADAIADFDKAIALAPNTLEGIFNRGVTREKANDRAGALVDYNRAVELAPTNTKILITRGLFKYGSGDLQGARADFDRVIEIDPENSMALANRGVVRNELGDNVGAIADFDKAIELEPDDATSFYNRGNAKRALGDQAGAIADYDGALVLRPNDPHSFTNRGNAKKTLGDYEGASADYDRAIELSPNLWTAWAGRAQVLSRTDTEAAIAAFQHAYRHCDRPNIKPRLASDIRRLGGDVPTDD